MTAIKRRWLRGALQFKGSVIPAIWSRVLFCALFGFFISVFHYYGLHVSWPVLESLIPNVVLGLLLVLRTNTAYERFWEGRKLWGTLVNTVRNLARQIWVTVGEKEVQDAGEKIATLRLLIAFAVATKLHLRQEPVNSELEALMSLNRYLKLKTMNNPPLEIAFWIGDYLKQQHNRHCLDTYQLISIYKLLDEMVDVLGGCERILKTPLPQAYSIHLKQLLLIYCLSLPFQMVENFNWATAIIVGIISFTLFGIEEIAIEIENPFGRDANDLPLDTICTTIHRNIEDLISQYPSVHKKVENSQTTAAAQVSSSLVKDAEEQVVHPTGYPHR